MIPEQERSTRNLRKRKNEGSSDKKETYSQKLRRRKETFTKAKKKSEEDSEERQNGSSATKDLRVPVSNVACSGQSDLSGLFDFRPRATEPKINISTPSTERSRNMIHFMQQYSLGQKCTVKLKQSVSNMVVNILSDMQLCQTLSPFDRRVTAMEWHPTKSNVLAVGSKGGDIIMWDVSNSKKEKFIQGMGAGGIINALKFWPHNDERIVSAAVDGTVTLHDIEGRHTQILADTCNPHEGMVTIFSLLLSFKKGSGGNIQALRFWPQDYDKVVSAGLDGTITLHDLNGKHSHVLSDTLNFYDFWYCSVDIHADRKCLVAGDNVGNTQLLSYEGQKIFSSRLHKQKVTHCAFSPREEWLLCTASTDQTVKFWDVRMMKDRGSVLYTLKHDKPVNSAYFSRTDGCRLLTTDQNNQVRVYKAPDWTLEKTILHPHRFFQHITPIKATWYPLQDLAVVGRYPDPKFPGYYDGEPRTIDIIDVESETVVTSLSDPNTQGLVCVNQFNRTGDILASGMGLHILLWKRKEEMAQLQESLGSKFNSATNSLKSGRSSRPPRSDQQKKPQTKKKLDSETKQSKVKLKMKLKVSKE